MVVPAGHLLLRVFRRGGEVVGYAYQPWTPDVLHEVTLTGPAGEYGAERVEADFLGEADAIIPWGTPYLVTSDGDPYLRLTARAGEVGDPAGTRIRDRLAVGREDLVLRYKARFPLGFDWVLGGKLLSFRSDNLGNPGAGINPVTPEGFSVSVMWHGSGGGTQPTRKDGRLVLYVYHADLPGGYGEDFPLVWPTTGEDVIAERGVWYEIVVRARMNTDGHNDGLLEAWARREGDGPLLPVFYRSDMRYWAASSDWYGVGRINTRMFFGGDTPEWAPATEQQVHVRDVAYLVPL